MSSTSSGGYDNKLVGTKIPDEYVCMICQLLAREAHQTGCCGKIFCKSCLLSLKQAYKRYECPNCRRSLAEFNHFMDVRANHEISSLKVCCVNGCEWRGEVRHIDDHVGDCPKREVKCNKCEETVTFDTLDDHSRTTCPKRSHSCPHCSETREFDFITGRHVDVCPDLVVNCPNEACNVQVKQGEVSKHQAVCPKEVVECCHAVVGCPIKRKRDEMDEHLNTAVKDHLEYSSKRIKVLEEKFNICPLVIKFARVSTFTSADSVWYSPGCYTSRGGYKVQLRVYANGRGTAKGTHLSCHILFLPGEYDQNLEWPFRGTIMVEILNQLNNYNHFAKSIKFTEGMISGKGDGSSEFISLSKLVFNPRINTQYLKDDVLHFRVSASKVLSGTKVWLA